MGGDGDGARRNRLRADGSYRPASARSAVGPVGAARRCRAPGSPMTEIAEPSDPSWKARSRRALGRLAGGADEQGRLILWLLRWIVLGIGVGVLAGLSSALFLKMLEWSTRSFAEHGWLLYLLPARRPRHGLPLPLHGRPLDRGQRPRHRRDPRAPHRHPPPHGPAGARSPPSPPTSSAGRPDGRAPPSRCRPASPTTPPGCSTCRGPSGARCSSPASPPASAPCSGCPSPARCSASRSRASAGCATRPSCRRSPARWSATSSCGGWASSTPRVPQLGPVDLDAVLILKIAAGRARRSASSAPCSSRPCTW